MSSDEKQAELAAMVQYSRDVDDPAYWRGNDDAIAGVMGRVENILDGLDSGAGCLGNARLEKIRRRIIALLPSTNNL